MGPQGKMDMLFLGWHGAAAHASVASLLPSTSRPAPTPAALSIGLSSRTIHGKGWQGDVSLSQAFSVNTAIGVQLDHPLTSLMTEMVSLGLTLFERGNVSLNVFSSFLFT